MVYIDGFNLYYGAVRNTPYKWLNPIDLCSKILTRNRIVKIKYFTAKVTSRAKDPDQGIRQETYLRALRTIPNLEIFYGHFLSHDVWMKLSNPPSKGPEFVQVVKTEEKGSEYNSSWPKYVHSYPWYLAASSPEVSGESLRHLNFSSHTFDFDSTASAISGPSTGANLNPCPLPPDAIVKPSISGW